MKVDRLHHIISLCHHKLIRNFNLFQPYKFSKFSDRLYTCIVNNCYTDTQNSLCIISNMHNSESSRHLLNEYLK